MKVFLFWMVEILNCISSRVSFIAKVVNFCFFASCTENARIVLREISGKIQWSCLVQDLVLFSLLKKTIYKLEATNLPEARYEVSRLKNNQLFLTEI